MGSYSIIGKRLPRIDAPSKATGASVYVTDFSLPLMLFGKILRSPYPHARIVRIDSSRAKKLPGVKAVITGEESGAVPFGIQMAQNYSFSDKLPLAVSKVRFVGDEVAALAAASEDVAEEALKLIEVEYEELTAVFDPEMAMTPEAPSVNGKGNNIAWEIHLNLGDVNKGFNESDYVREDRFALPPAAHCTLEPHSCLACFDQGGKVTIWSTSQAPHRVRVTISRLLNMPVSKVRVITLAMGGGFGSKAGIFSSDACAVLLAKKTARPVKIVLTREEVFSATRVRHAQTIHMKTGVKKDGTLVAQEVKIVSDNGAYTSLGGVGLCNSVAFLNSPFKIPNLKCDAYLVYTNKPMGGAMRGYGAPQVRFAADSQLDTIAKDLGLDTAQLMLKNAVRSGEVLANGFRISSCGLDQCIKEVTGAADRPKLRTTDKVSWGKGIGCHTFICGAHRDPFTGFSALVRVHEDGGISLLTGAVDVGQGSSSVLAQIVAEEFGVQLEDIRVVPQDTEVTPPAQGTYSSKVTFWEGNAVKAAAADAKQQLFQVVAEKLEADPQDLVAKDKRVYVKGSPEKGMSIDEAVLAYQFDNQGKPLIGRGHYKQSVHPVDHETSIGNNSPAYSFGCTLAEVEVDRETGQVKVLKLTIAHDCGFALNTMAVEGQLEGASLMGMGYALGEQLLRQEGTTMNPSFLDYKVAFPSAAPEVQTFIVETVDPGGPFGAKEVGEGPIVSIAPAIANAIYDAVGVRINDLPIRPEKVLRALEKKEG